jgi:hypothetical protein
MIYVTGFTFQGLGGMSIRLSLSTRHTFRFRVQIQGSGFRASTCQACMWQRRDLPPTRALRNVPMQLTISDLTRYMACSYVALSLYVLLLLLHCVTEGRAAQPGVPQHPDRGRVQIRPPVRPLSPEAGSLSPEAGSRPPVRETVIDLLPVLAAYCLKQGLMC